MKDFFKKIQRDVVRSTLFFLVWLFGWMPYRPARAFSLFVFNIVYLFLGRLRRLAHKTTTIAFGNSKTHAQREEIIHESFDSSGESIIEIMQFISRHHVLEEQVDIEGINHLEDALAKGNGVIVPTGHFGNFAFMMLYLARRGYKTNCIIRPQRDMALTRDLQKKIEIHGFYPVYSRPRVECVKKSLRLLRQNELLFVLIDQNYGSEGGVYIDFFGKPASTATGPIVLARRSGATILPMFIVREAPQKHRIIIQEPHEMIERDDTQEMLTLNMQAISARLQKMIEQYPNHWAWMHDRWKTQPPSQAGT